MPHARPFVALLVVSLALGCTSRTRVTHADANIGNDAGTTLPHDTGATPLPDAFVPGVDAFVPGVDAFVPGVDAFVPGTDAFVPPVDAGNDAFVAPVDAFVPPTDAGTGGCTPLPTSTPLVIDGTISAGATYNRPTTSCGTPSAVGTDVYYATHVFCNAGAARSYSFALDAAATGGIGDPFLIVYTGTGDVSTLACLASDDDGGGSSNSLATATVPAATTITIVATDFDNGSTGDYVLTITPM